MPSQNLTDAVAFRHSSPEAQNTFIVSWCFFNLCNYDCSYCMPNLKNGTFKGLPFERVREIVDGLFRAHPKKKFLFEFTGGEITIYRDFTQLITYLHEKGCDVSILSNGSRPTGWWEQHAPLLTHVCLSFHVERAQQEHFLAVLAVITRTTSVHLNLMVMPGRLKECLALYAAVEAQFPSVSLALQPLAPNEEIPPGEYSARELFVLQTQHADTPEGPMSGPGFLFSKPHVNYRESMVWQFAKRAEVPTTAQEVIAEGTNQWQGWKCSAGLEMVMIDWQGDIHRAWCKVGGRVGNIHDPTIHWPAEAVMCTKAHCRFGLDIMSTKERVP